MASAVGDIPAAVRSQAAVGDREQQAGSRGPLLNVAQRSPQRLAQHLGRCARGPAADDRASLVAADPAPAEVVLIPLADGPGRGEGGVLDAEVGRNRTG